MTTHPFGPSSRPPVHLGDFEAEAKPRALVGFEVTGLSYGARGVLYASFRGTTVPLAVIVAPDSDKGAPFTLTIGDGVLELTDSPVFCLSEHGVVIPKGQGWGLWGRDFFPPLPEGVAIKPIYR